MVMADRDGVATAPGVIAALDTMMLGQQLAAAMLRVPFRNPLRGPANPAVNVAAAVTRETVRSFMGFTSSLPVDEFRSIEQILDRVCGYVMPPVVASYGVTHRTVEIGGVPGILYEPVDATPHALVLTLREQGAVPAGLLLFSPEIDLELDEASVTENAATDILPWNIPTAAYLHGVDPREGLVSAVDADLTGFPPTFVCWGGQEMFRDPIRRYVDRLAAAGVPHVGHEEAGMFHVFPILMPWSAPSRRVHRAVDVLVHGHLDPGRDPLDLSALR